MVVGRAGIPAKKFSAGDLAYGRCSKFFANGIDKPLASVQGAIARGEIGTKPKAVLSGSHAGRIVGSAAHSHTGPVPAPRLVGKAWLVQADGVVEIGQPA